MNQNKGTESKLVVRGLTKLFEGKEVLHALDFDVHDGEFLSILGPSGCGKTTTLRILSACSRPTAAASSSTAATSRTPRPTTAAWASCSRTMRCSKT